MRSVKARLVSTINVAAGNYENVVISLSGLTHEVAQADAAGGTNFERR
jgi:hypothetical protein